MQGKQAKMVRPTPECAILGSLATTRSPARDRVLFLLSMKAGLRAKEMASRTWAMVTDATGQVAEVLHVPNRASKGKTGQGSSWLPLQICGVKPTVSEEIVAQPARMRDRGKTHAAHARDAVLILQDFYRSDTVG
jgi:hypothetical protein